jgi:hypothetical protein
MKSELPPQQNLVPVVVDFHLSRFPDSSSKLELKGGELSQRNRGCQFVVWKESSLRLKVLVVPGNQSANSYQNNELISLPK